MGVVFPEDTDAAAASNSSPWAADFAGVNVGIAARMSEWSVSFGGARVPAGQMLMCHTTVLG